MAIYLENKLTITILFFVFSFNCYAQTITTPIYTLNNALWHPDSISENIIILKNNRNCLKCFTDLFSYLKDSLNKTNVYCLSQTDSSVFARKYENNTLQNLMQGVVPLFEYKKTEDWNFHENSDNSIFKKNNITITPSLIYLKNNKYIIIPYEKIFVNGKIGKGFLP